MSPQQELSAALEEWRSHSVPNDTRLSAMLPDVCAALNKVFAAQNKLPPTAQGITKELNAGLDSQLQYLDDNHYRPLPRTSPPLVNSLTGLPIEKPKIGWYSSFQTGVVVCDPMTKIKVTSVL